MNKYECAATVFLLLTTHCLMELDQRYELQLNKKPCSGRDCERAVKQAMNSQVHRDCPVK